MTKEILIIKKDDLENEIIFNKGINSIQEFGAIIVKGLISEDFSNELKSALIKCLKEDEINRGNEYLFHGMVHALMTRDKVFRSLLENEFILKLTRGVLGKGAINHAFNSSSMPPKGTNFSRSIHVDCPRFIPNYITNIGITIALDPFKSENGAMEIMPMSFRDTEPPTESDFEKNSIQLNNLEVGDAIIFNARCWHRGGLNSTSNWRHSVTMNNCRAYMRQQFDYPSMFSESESNDFSEDLKQFLGYFVRIPKSMDDFLLPASQRLYKPGQE